MKVYEENKQLKGIVDSIKELRDSKVHEFKNGGKTVEFIRVGEIDRILQTKEKNGQ